MGLFRRRTRLIFRVAIGTICRAQSAEARPRDETRSGSALLSVPAGKDQHRHETSGAGAGSFPYIDSK